MKKPYYIYVTEDCIDSTKDTVIKLRGMQADGCAVFIIGKDHDNDKVKAEYTDAMSRGYKVYLMLEDGCSFDDELEQQFAFLKSYGFDDESVKQLSLDLAMASLSDTKEAPKWARPVVIAAMILAFAAVFVLLIKFIL